MNRKIPKRLHCYLPQTKLPNGRPPTPLGSKGFTRFIAKLKKFANKMFQKTNPRRNLSTLNSLFGSTGDKHHIFIVETIKHLKRSLNLNYSITPVTMNNFNRLTRGILSLQNLQTLSLWLSADRLVLDDPYGYKSVKLFRILRSLKKLRNLSLSCDITHISFCHMVCDGLKTLKNLKYLSLRFSSIKILDESVAHLAECINSLVDLQSLTIDLSENELSQIGLDLFLKNIGNLGELGKLRELYLILDLNYENLKCLKHCVKQLKHLKMFCLSFIGDSEISETCMQDLEDSISCLESLKVLEIEVRFAPKASMLRLIKQMSTSNITLEDIHLRCFGMYFDEKETIEMFESLNSLQRLKSLSLFTKIELSSDSVDQAVNIVMGYESLQTININGVECSDKQNLKRVFE